MEIILSVGLREKSVAAIIADLKSMRDLDTLPTVEFARRAIEQRIIQSFNANEGIKLFCMCGWFLKLCREKQMPESWKSIINALCEAFNDGSLVNEKDKLSAEKFLQHWKNHLGKRSYVDEPLTEIWSKCIASCKVAKIRVEPNELGAVRGYLTNDEKAETQVQTPQNTKNVYGDSRTSNSSHSIHTTPPHTSHDQNAQLCYDEDFPPYFDSPEHTALCSVMLSLCRETSIGDERRLLAFRLLHEYLVRAPFVLTETESAPLLISCVLLAGKLLSEKCKTSKLKRVIIAYMRVIERRQSGCLKKVDATDNAKHCQMSDALSSNSHAPLAVTPSGVPSSASATANAPLHLDPTTTAIDANAAMNANIFKENARGAQPSVLGDLEAKVKAMEMTLLNCTCFDLTRLCETPLTPSDGTVPCLLERLGASVRLDSDIIQKAMKRCNHPVYLYHPMSALRPVTDIAAALLTVTAKNRNLFAISPPLGASHSNIISLADELVRKSNIYSEINLCTPSLVSRSNMRKFSKHEAAPIGKNLNVMHASVSPNPDSSLQAHHAAYLSAPTESSLNCVDNLLDASVQDNEQAANLDDSDWQPQPDSPPNLPVREYIKCQRQPEPDTEYDDYDRAIRESYNQYEDNTQSASSGEHNRRPKSVNYYGDEAGREKTYLRDDQNHDDYANYSRPRSRLQQQSDFERKVEKRSRERQRHSELVPTLKGFYSYQSRREQHNNGRQTNEFSYKSSPTPSSNNEYYRVDERDNYTYGRKDARYETYWDHRHCRYDYDYDYDYGHGHGYKFSQQPTSARDFLDDGAVQPYNKHYDYNDNFYRGRDARHHKSYQEFQYDHHLQAYHISDDTLSRKSFAKVPWMASEHELGTVVANEKARNSDSRHPDLQVDRDLPHNRQQHRSKAGGRVDRNNRIERSVSDSRHDQDNVFHERSCQSEIWRNGTANEPVDNSYYGDKSSIPSFQTENLTVDVSKSSLENSRISSSASATATDTSTYSGRKRVLEDYAQTDIANARVNQNHYRAEFRKTSLNNDFISTLESIAKLPRIRGVNNISVSRNSEGIETDSVSATVDVNGYPGINVAVEVECDLDPEERTALRLSKGLTSSR